MTNRSRTQDPSYCETKPRARSALRIRKFSSHFAPWPILVLLGAGCTPEAALKTVSVRVTPDAGEEPIDAASPGHQTPPAASSTCTVTPTFLETRRACSVDTDCVAIPYRPNCCDSTLIAGVARADEVEVRDCVDKQAPVCMNKCVSHPTRTDDGRVSIDPEFGDVTAHCVQGQCRSAIAARLCGDAPTCNATEVCVSYATVPGGAAPPPGSGDVLLDYACMPNPCKGNLDCSCAQSLCDARKDAPRKCAIDFVFTADVDCGRIHD